MQEVDHQLVRTDWREDAIDPTLPIIDAHHHLWDRTAMLELMREPVFGWQKIMTRTPRYLAEDLAADIAGGHNVVATVFVECGSFYHASGAEEFRAIGESEFVAGVAEGFATARQGPRACAGIVAHADLTLGDRVMPVLEAHYAAAKGRLRGIRQGMAHDSDPAVLGPINAPEPQLYRSVPFREGFARLAPLGLVFDAYLLEPQLAELIDLAKHFPETTIVIDHLGVPLGIGSYAGRREQRYGNWQKSLRQLAELPNVSIKLGGLGMELAGFESFLSNPPVSSERLANEWRPYIETAIDLFGADRCMFESNYPADCGVGDYGTIWNAFKRVASSASTDEKAALFSGTAARIYTV